ncbi:MAG: hypothetical protein WAK48_06380, partial [Candidatus Acidiferrum sp.]
DQEVEGGVAKVDGQESPEIGGENTFARGEVIAEVAEETNFWKLTDRGERDLLASELELDFARTKLLVLHPAEQPTGNVATAGNGRDVIELVKELGLGQSLDHSKVEGGTTDATSGESETNQTVFRGRCELGIETSLARGADPSKFVFENGRVEDWRRGHGAPV